MKNNKSKNMVGITAGQQANAANNFNEEKFHGARGHGFAAERANDLYDKLTGKNARIIGDDNAKDGTDRVVNGINIQSKYCHSGSKCIRECFHGNQFRYYNKDIHGNYIMQNGTKVPMQIEVPSDKYDDAVKAMQERINRGEIEGAKRAEDIVRKGNITYEQAKNITKFGNIDSLKYDATNGMITGLYSGCISSAIAFAVSSYKGKSFDEALQDSAKAGLKVGGISFAGSVLAGQLSKAGLNSALVSSSDAIAQAIKDTIGKDAIESMINAFRNGSAGIHGAAAMKSFSKMLRSNAITGVATVVIMSVGDISNIFQSKISGTQFVKNFLNTSANVAGGTGGWVAGAAAGSTFGPIGTFVGGLLGAFAGSKAADKVSKKVLDQLIENDSIKMLKIVEEESKTIAYNYLLNESEFKNVIELLKSDLKDDSKLQRMFQSNDRNKFAYEWLEGYADTVIKRRLKIYLPSDEAMLRGLNKLLNSNNEPDNNSSIKGLSKKPDINSSIIEGLSKKYIRLR